MYGFKVDYIDDIILYTQMIIREWKSRRACGIIDMAQNRFEVGYDEIYKAWLKEDLQMTLTPGPNTYDQVEDMVSKTQPSKDLASLYRKVSLPSGWKEVQHRYLRKLRSSYSRKSIIWKNRAMTRRRIERVDQNKEALLVKAEEVGQQIDWVIGKIARIVLEIVVSLRALHEVSKSFPAEERNF
ncbi:hypothetical protein HAX54_032121 [Datura stramonium]|uniref:Uncharacterized protein n=1 Tax=Datura stramonium TaxID=4076 RepID=A0ABS8VAA8_DATST|nr:hypothetical protein [Datura stramonium]